jgi:magnesium transporter
MQADIITVDPMIPQREVARIVAKYNLLSVPVVDAEKVMQGIVTVDDAIDAIIPTAWKKRLPRIF